jgi:hypothetical protein
MRAKPSARRARSSCFSSLAAASPRTPRALPPASARDNRLPLDHVADALADQVRQRLAAGEIPMRAGPGQHLAGRDVVFLPHQQVAAEIGDQPLPVVDVGLIERRAKPERLFADVIRRRIIVAIVLVCEGFIFSALFPKGGPGGSGGRKRRMRGFGGASSSGEEDSRTAALFPASPGRSWL